MNSRLIFSSALVALLTLMCHAGFSQIRYIKLTYLSSVSTQNNAVKVTIHETGDTGENYKVVVAANSWKREPASKPQGEITISKEEFRKLAAAVQEIQPEDVIAGPEPANLDGSSCSVSYGNFKSSVTYSVSTPDLDTSKRKLDGFLKAFELILQAGRLEPRGIIK